MGDARWNWSVAPVSQVLLVPLVQWFVHEHGYRMLVLAVVLAALPVVVVAWQLRKWQAASRAGAEMKSGNGQCKGRRLRKVPPWTTRTPRAR